MSSAEQLWTAIYDFYCLLVSKNNEEASYQRLFEQHPAIFTVLGIDTAASFEKVRQILFHMIKIEVLILSLTSLERNSKLGS